MAPTEGSRMKGKVAIVTGGGSGFGRAIALRFMSEGCKVLVGDLNAETAEKTVAIASSPENGMALQMDVTKEIDWRRAVEEADAKFGRLDCVVNNAGWSYKNRPTDEVGESDFDRCFTVNVKSVFWSVSAAVPHMKKTGTGGSFINISSIGSSRPRPGLVWYNASKGAVSNATKGLAAEYGSENIRFNAICPLLSGTGLFESFVGVPYTEENVKKFVTQVPLGRLTDPMDVANAALFLASEDGKFCTGVLLDVDGGKGI